MGFPTEFSVGESGWGDSIIPGGFRRDDLRRETCISVVDYHPDPLFVKNLQVDRAKQGVGGSPSGHV
jgi:hypothetical protein